MSNANKILEVKDLTISFNTYAGKVQAVRGISFDLFEGETLAIVGESGSGKTVSTRSLIGLLAATAEIGNGTAIYNPPGADSIDLLPLKDKEWNAFRGKEIAMIFQDPFSSLNPIKRIGKQISEIFTMQHKLSKVEAKLRAIELMRRVGIPMPEKRYSQYPFQFSGGMRQRIVIAIALASDPKILICDEPTTALDVTIQAQVLALISEIRRERNISTIFITHDLGVVAHVADRIAVMYAGKIVEYGTAHEVFYNPQHPYTWSLMSSMPDMDIVAGEELEAIQGTPPNMLYPPEGDAFAERNPNAVAMDLKMHPPMFKVSDTHYAATWLLHPNAPKVERPALLERRIKNSLQRQQEREQAK
ncbi:MAG: ABC transporter ATP-binding protein [Defluviitaleaceae bacterium]|nr:ABC transporter ATP-binding protein [Defluviitaleaceae bacterium]